MNEENVLTKICYFEKCLFSDEIVTSSEDDLYDFWLFVMNWANQGNPLNKNQLKKLDYAKMCMLNIEEAKEYFVKFKYEIEATFGFYINSQ